LSRARPYIIVDATTGEGNLRQADVSSPCRSEPATRPPSGRHALVGDDPVEHGARGATKDDTRPNAELDLRLALGQRSGASRDGFDALLDGGLQSIGGEGFGASPAETVEDHGRGRRPARPADVVEN
jgi:hypothetical protein